MVSEAQWDFFISHASEDKADIAKPLAEILQALGFQVWYDEFSLKLGDSLNETINKGLAASKKGIVILSSNFFAKNWPKRELDGLVAQETISGEIKILPIRHKITIQEIAHYSPTLADKKTISSSEGIENIVREIIRAVEGSITLPEYFPSPAYDILLQTDVLVAFQQMRDFKDRNFTVEELSNLWGGLWINQIRTREKLSELSNSEKLFDALRKIYQEELLRSQTIR